MKVLNITLEQIIELHEAYSDKTQLTSVIGDGYLYSQSKVFKAIRDCALDAKIKFAADSRIANSDESTVWLETYQQFPFLMLSHIYKQRTVPCRKSTEAFYFLKENTGSQAYQSCFNSNSILHETVHLLANDFLGGDVPHFTSSSHRFDLAARILAVEAMANTIEFMFVHEKLGAEFWHFSQIHSFLIPSFEVHCALNFLVARIGYQAVFKFVFYSHFLSNYYFAVEKPDRNLSRKIITHLQLKLSNYEDELLFSILDKAFTLNRTFTSVTTQGYIASIGGPHSLDEAYAFDVNQVLFGNRKFEDLADYFVNLLIQEDVVRGVS